MKRAHRPRDSVGGHGLRRLRVERVALGGELRLSRRHDRRCGGYFRRTSHERGRRELQDGTVSTFFVADTAESSGAGEAT